MGLRRVRGFITGYILYGIALLAVVGAAYARMNAANEQGKLIDTTTKELVSQVEVIRSKVLLCAAIYPAGNNTFTTAYQEYPAFSGQASGSLNAVTCPGSSGPLTLGQLSDGVPMPLIPPDFNAWVYQHDDTNGVRLLLSPRVSGGASGIRTRLLKQLGSLAASSGDTIIVTLLQ